MIHIRQNNFQRDIEAVDTGISFGEWQLCPKCCGTGLLQPPYQVTGTSVVTGICDVCSGAKIIAKPIIAKGYL